MTDKPHFEGDMKYLTKEGKELWTMSTYVCVKDHNKEIQKILYLGIDITDKKKQNLDYQGQIEALHRSSIKAEYSPNGEIIFYNDLFKEMLGFSTEHDFENKTVYNFLPKEDIKDFKKTWNNILDGNVFKDQIRHIRKNDEEKWLQATFSVVHNMYGDIEKIIFIAHDITDQRRIELEAKKQSEVLKDQEAKLLKNVEEMKSIQNEMIIKNKLIEAERTKSLSILEGCVEGIVTFDKKGKIDSFNKAAENIFSLNKQDFIGKKIDKVFPLEIEVDGDSYKVYYVKDDERIRLENNVKIEIWIHNDFIQQKSILLTLLEIISGDEISFTAFFQDIEVELF
jgi:PAS domain S-box-containing protein